MKISRINPPSLYESVQYGFSHATLQEGGRTLYMAGQVAWNAQCEVVGEGDLAAQTRQSLDNLRAVLAAAGGAPENIVSLRTYVVNHSPDKLGVVLKEVGAFFGSSTPPPNTFIGVAALALPPFLVEIEAVAAI
jgi:enamine deaminase RidA (YjgF/YER057c/UK114 family)